MQQVFAHVKPNAACPNHGHSLAHGLFVAQHVQIAQYLGVVHALNLRQARADAGGQHHVLEARLHQIVCRHVLPQFDGHAGLLEALTKITQGFVKLFLARNLFGNVELAANLVTRIQQRHLQPTLGRFGGKGQTRWASADHGNALFLRSGWQGLRQQNGFMASAGIHQAGGDLARKGVVQAGLVAANAGVDVLRPPGSCLIHKLRVGQEGPRHAHHVSLAAGEDVFCHIRGVDAVGGHQWNADLALELLGHPGKGGARHLGGNGGNAGLVPANAGVQNRHARRFQRLRQLHHFVLRGAAFDQIKHRQAEDDDEVLAHPRARAAHDLQRKADAVLVAAAVLVIALVGLCGDEFVDEVALRAHDFHTVIARALRQGCGVGVVLDRLLHFLGGQCLGGKRADGGFEGAGGHQLRVVGVAAKVQDLHANFAACVMHGLRYHPVLVGLGLRSHGRAAGHGPARFVGGNAAGHDQAHAALGPLGVKRRHALKAIGRFFQPHVHGAHEYAVFQRGKAQVQRGQQVGVRGCSGCNGSSSGHGMSLANQNAQQIPAKMHGRSIIVAFKDIVLALPRGHSFRMKRLCSFCMLPTL